MVVLFCILYCIYCEFLQTQSTLTVGLPSQNTFIKYCCASSLCLGEPSSTGRDLSVDLLMDEALKCCIGDAGKANSHQEPSVLNKHTHTQSPKTFLHTRPKGTSLTAFSMTAQKKAFGCLRQKLTPSLTFAIL